MVLEKTLESHLGYREITPVNPKGSKPWIFIESADMEAGAPVLWPPSARNQLIGRVPDAGKDCRQNEKRAAEDETDR